MTWGGVRAMILEFVKLVGTKYHSIMINVGHKEESKAK